MTKAEKTKQLILEKAGLIYNAKGINGTAIDDVTRAAGVTKGALYSHFENKEDLSLQTADYLLNKIADGIAQAMSKKKTAKGKIFAYLDFNKLPLNTYIDGGCPIFNMAVEADDNHAPIKKKVSRMVSFSQEGFAKILKGGIENGEFADNLDPEVMAFKIFSAVEGGIVMCRVLNTNAPMQGLIKSLKDELERYEKK
ncbi:TetR/AcrR family transcriptional regulator [Dyadobacter frigoris]|uniref:TetR/AcrR family transcriptional regulator n=1 Tax=Dyadobacter frigoris TaxID=2576211 RepID=A0A4V6Y206_9BACT|nr:TetR/AcrR family transcriptional regulator [Dyadobacter frigoris]TKT93403.1 TetR/AcrR family transcriptional regulator [Dyadobacter frigoris]